MKKIKYIFILLVITCLSNYGQSLRSLVNNGVDEYDEKNYAEAEVQFKKGIESNVESFESRFNLGDAIYKQGRFDEALEEFKNTIPLAESDNNRANIYHNIGNSFVKSQKLQESIAAYKESLKLNPNDMETKYNLSYALKQMKNQQDNQQNQQNQENQDQNQDQDQQNQDQQDQNQDQKEEQQPENKEQDKKQDQQQQKPKDDISKEEAKRILDALKNNEAELQKKMREQKTKKSNVEKDW